MIEFDTTNPTIEQLYKHRSIRAYKTDPLERSTIEQIVAAGQRASTSSNMHQYSVVVVTDQAKRDRLMALCGDQKQIGQAPVFMAWCADVSRLRRAAGRLGNPNEIGYVENFLVSAVDAALAMQNAAVAAESLGLGMCYIGAIRNNAQDVVDLLNLPEGVFPISGMVLGWPDQEPIYRPRLDKNAIIHWESYSTENDEKYVTEYDEMMINTGIYKGRQVPVPGKEGEMRNYGWQEHSTRRASKPLRTHLRDVLNKQGFTLK